MICSWFPRPQKVAVLVPKMGSTAKNGRMEAGFSWSLMRISSPGSQPYIREIVFKPSAMQRTKKISPGFALINAATSARISSSISLSQPWISTFTWPSRAIRRNTPSIRSKTGMGRGPQPAEFI